MISIGIGFVAITHREIGITPISRKMHGAAKTIAYRSPTAVIKR
jgi:hypothetical protein